MRSFAATIFVFGIALAVAITLPATAAAQRKPKVKRRKLPPDYRIKMLPLLKAERNKTAAVSLTIAPQPGYVISRDGPVRLQLAVTPKSGLKLKQLRYRRKHAADARADSPRFDLQMKAAQVGTFKVHIAIRFWVCAKRTCRPVRDRRVLSVVVKEPAPASQPATQPNVNAKP